jgi:hypothetical protein
LDLTPPEAIARWLHIQSRWCERLGSPLYATLLERAGDDASEGGPVFEAMRGHEDDPPGSALALRFMGAVHRLVLSGAAPRLAPFYPSVAGRPFEGDPWPAFRTAVEAHLDDLRFLIERPVQTNEPGRSAALLGGFLTVARETRLPLRVLEIGSSAGLNLRWDHYRYESGDWTWGETTSPVTLTEVFEGSAPEPGPAEVVERGGCDMDPLDASTEDGRLTLLSYTWPDQRHRFATLKGALEVAVRVPAPVERADGPSWLSAQLARQAPGVATVVFHSMVGQYLGEDGRSRLRSALSDAAQHATTDAPLAWLRFEPSNPEGGGRFLVHLTIWPGGDERLLAEAHPHGPPIRWLA